MKHFLLILFALILGNFSFSPNSHAYGSDAGFEQTPDVTADDGYAPAPQAPVATSDDGYATAPQVTADDGYVSAPLEVDDNLKRAADKKRQAELDAAERKRREQQTKGDQERKCTYMTGRKITVYESDSRQEYSNCKASNRCDSELSSCESNHKTMRGQGMSCFGGAYTDFCGSVGRACSNSCSSATKACRNFSKKKVLIATRNQKTCQIEGKTSTLNKRGEVSTVEGERLLASGHDPGMKGLDGIDGDKLNNQIDQNIGRQQLADQYIAYGESRTETTGKTTSSRGLTTVQTLEQSHASEFASIKRSTHASEFEGIKSRTLNVEDRPAFNPLSNSGGGGDGYNAASGGAWGSNASTTGSGGGVQSSRNPGEIAYDKKIAAPTTIGGGGDGSPTTVGGGGGSPTLVTDGGGSGTGTDGGFGSDPLASPTADPAGSNQGSGGQASNNGGNNFGGGGSSDGVSGGGSGNSFGGNPFTAANALSGKSSSGSRTSSSGGSSSSDSEGTRGRSRYSGTSSSNNKFSVNPSRSALDSMDRSGGYEQPKGSLAGSRGSYSGSKYPGSQNGSQFAAAARAAKTSPVRVASLSPKVRGSKGETPKGPGRYAPAAKKTALEREAEKLDSPKGGKPKVEAGKKRVAQTAAPIDAELGRIMALVTSRMKRGTASVVSGGGGGKRNLHDQFGNNIWYSHKPVFNHAESMYNNVPQDIDGRYMIETIGTR